MPICMESIPMDLLFSSAESVLTGMQFQIDKADRQAGQIITRPLRRGQFFEIWRQDNATGADVAESNLHSLQRIAEVRFDSEGSLVCTNCRVYVRRLSMPGQPIRGTRSTSYLFTDRSGSWQSLQIAPDIEEQAEWIYLGNDPDLEQAILRKIEKSIGRGSGT